MNKNYSKNGCYVIDVKELLQKARESMTEQNRVT